MDDSKDVVNESWDVEADMATVQQKWAEFTTALRYSPGPSNGPSGAWLRWVRPETEAENEQISLEEITPTLTRVNVSFEYEEKDLAEEGESFADVALRVDQDMLLFKAYAEGRLPKDTPAARAS